MRSERLVKEIAKERIARLLSLAEEMAKNGDELSKRLEKRYVGLARRISEHYKVKIPKELKQRICKKCNNFLVPGVNCTVRLSSSGYLVYKCECGNENHIFVKPKASAGASSRAPANN